MKIYLFDTNPPFQQEHIEKSNAAECQRYLESLGYRYTETKLRENHDEPYSVPYEHKFSNGSTYMSTKYAKRTTFAKMVCFQHRRVKSKFACYHVHEKDSK